MKDMLNISVCNGGSDDKLFCSVWNQGIDSHLEAFTKSKFRRDANRLHLNFHQGEVALLVRRLMEVGTEDALRWAGDIDEYEAEDVGPTLVVTIRMEPHI